MNWRLNYSTSTGCLLVTNLTSGDRWVSQVRAGWRRHKLPLTTPFLNFTTPYHWSLHLRFQFWTIMKTLLFDFEYASVVVRVDFVTRVTQRQWTRGRGVNKYLSLFFSQPHRIVPWLGLRDGSSPGRVWIPAAKTCPGLIFCTANTTTRLEAHWCHRQKHRLREQWWSRFIEPLASLGL